MKQQARFKHKQYIGIDPDSEKSGIARLILFDKKDADGNIGQLDIGTDHFHAVEDVLKRFTSIESDTLIAIEKCWSSSSNWHLPKFCTPNAASKIGIGIGKCHMVGMLLKDFCEQSGFNYTLVEPLKKIWGKTRNEKISHNELVQVARSMHIKFTEKTSNQEKRDAALIVLTRL